MSDLLLHGIVLALAGTLIYLLSNPEWVTELRIGFWLRILIFGVVYAGFCVAIVAEMLR